MWVVTQFICFVLPVALLVYCVILFLFLFLISLHICASITLLFIDMSRMLQAKISHQTYASLVSFYRSYDYFYYLFYSLMIMNYIFIICYCACLVTANINNDISSNKYSADYGQYSAWTLIQYLQLWDKKHTMLLFVLFTISYNSYFVCLFITPEDQICLSMCHQWKPVNSNPI